MKCEPPPLREKQDKLKRIIAGYGRAAVAFSGGADSSLVLWTAIQVLGSENVLVLTSRSCLLPSSELEQARTWAARHGLPSPAKHLFPESDPLALDEFTGNPPERCYICKKRAYRLFLDIAAGHGIKHLADGTNADDMNSTRPGLQALRELGIRTPLAEAGLTKQEVRLISRGLGLDTWNYPSASCLATRIPTGMKITLERLERIAALEAKLIQEGFSGCRVRLDRHEPATVYIELLMDDIGRLTASPRYSAIVDFFNDSGIKQIFLNLKGR